MFLVCVVTILDYLTLIPTFQLGRANKERWHEVVKEIARLEADGGDKIEIAVLLKEKASLEEKLSAGGM